MLKHENFETLTHCFSLSLSIHPPTQSASQPANHSVLNTRQTSNPSPFSCHCGRRNFCGAYKPELRQIPIWGDLDIILFFQAELLASESKLPETGTLSDHLRTPREWREQFWHLSFQHGHFMISWIRSVAKQATLLLTSNHQKDQQVTLQITWHPQTLPAWFWRVPGTVPGVTWGHSYMCPMCPAPSAKCSLSVMNRSHRMWCKGKSTCLGFLKLQ